MLALCPYYASTPNIVQIPAFLVSKDRLLGCGRLVTKFEKCSFESADFQMPPSDIELKLEILSDIAGIAQLPLPRVS
jgi:hypothetical protein